MPQPTFTELGGLLWIELGPNWFGFTEALNDAVSALSPRGEPPAVSTYWIDYALEGLARAPGDEITGGNTTRIVRTPTGVRAVSDYELFEEESMPVEDFRGLLTAWRERVVEQVASGDAARPAQAPYQRNTPR
jgi:hypothetical protein